MELTHGERIKLDSKDKKILEQLQKNARQSVANIAKKTKLPRDLIVYRIKKLENLKVIRYHHTSLNPAMLGFPLYSYVMFSMTNISLEDEKKFISFLKVHKNIIYVAKNSGKYDFTIGVCSEDYKSFDQILQDIRRKFSSLIKNYEVTPVIQEYKFDYMVDLI